MKVAIVHYWFLTRRGGEKVVESLLKIFPDADIYTLFYSEKEYGSYLKNQRVYTSKLNRPFFRKYYQKLFPLYPIGIKSLELKEKYDLIISSESGPAKGISNPDKIPHLCYVHSPMRYCWSHQELYIKSVPPIFRPFMQFFLEKLRLYDVSTINNVDLYISNSNNVAKRIANFYNKESSVIYPPISEELFAKKIHLKRESDFYLSFGAITPYKKIDLLIDTFNKNEKQLVIVGDGSELLKLKKQANKNIIFKGKISWLELEKIIDKTKALLFPGEEDFGMIPLELMAYGLPVIAYKKGGALETVVENRKDIEKSSGLFFDKQTPESLQEAVDYFEKIEKEFHPEWIREHAKKFTERVFLEKMKLKIEQLLKEKRITEHD